MIKEFLFVTDSSGSDVEINSNGTGRETSTSTGILLL